LFKLKRIRGDGVAAMGY